MSEAIQTTRPTRDIYLYADDVILDPYPVYRQIRDTAPAVWLPKNDLWAIGRFDDAVAALAANDVLISSKGVAANPRLNAITTPNILMTDAPDHRGLRKIIAHPVMPSGLSEVKPASKKRRSSWGFVAQIGLIWDSPHESSVIAGGHAQRETDDIQDPKLESL